MILAIDNWQGPDVIGLCEVEKREVLQDLVNTTNLKNFNYGIIHEECDDKRGIDVAMLYKKDRFNVLTYKYFKFYNDGRPTRDILYVHGVLLNKDTLHMFVNHWPSRFGGQARSEPKRMAAASFVRSLVDSLNGVYNEPKIIITGDLNDGTGDKSILESLKAETNLDSLEVGDLYNTSYHLQHKKKLGTHKYKSEWNLFDQMIVSPAIFNKDATVYLRPEDSFIFSPDWIQVEDDQFFGKKPFRTWAGPNYLGGFSDHFAVYIKLNIQ